MRFYTYISNIQNNNFYSNVYIIKIIVLYLNNYKSKLKKQQRYKTLVNSCYRFNKNINTFMSQ